MQKENHNHKCVMDAKEKIIDKYNQSYLINLIPKCNT